MLLMILFINGSSTVLLANKNQDQRLLISAKKRMRNARIFVQANLAKNLGNYRQAELYYLECLKIDPQDAASMYELASIYTAAEKHDLALQYATKAVKIDPSNTYYKILLSNIYQAQGNFQQSIELLKSLVKKFPERSEYIRQLAYVYVMAKEFQNAIDLLNNLEAKTGINDLISLQKHQLYLSLDEPNKAIYEIEKLIEEYPYETRFYSILAELYSRYNKDDKAIWAYHKIIENDPEDPYVHISLYDFYKNRDQKEKAQKELLSAFGNPNLSAESKFQLLFSEQIYTDQRDLAKKLVWAINEVHPDNPRAKGLKADLLYRSGELKEAKQLLEDIIAGGSKQYPWYELLLIIESDLRNVETMAALGEKVVGLYPDKPLPYLLTGLGKYQLNKYTNAEKYFLDGLKFANENQALLIQFHSSLGDVYHQLDRAEESDKAYETALSMDSLNSIVLNNYAYYLALRGTKLEKADRMSKLAVELAPDNASNIDTRAWVLYKLQQYKEALVMIEKAYDIDNKNPEIIEHYGDILFKIGDRKKALKFWKKAKDLGGKSEFLEQKINEKKLIE